MISYLWAILIGVATGFRTLTPLAVISWAAHAGWLHLENTWLAFLGAAVTPYVLTILALGELITDKLPSTPSRKIPIQFGARIVAGALCGAALIAPSGAWIGGLLAGAVGAVIGTLVGADLRGRLANTLGKDLPIALLEDAVAIGGAIFIVSRFA
ncbi:MAG TPA: DUF4126 family protein [Chthoniobacteraceae bacterium]|nr:DUF4126 family protein [Chthoniobacteraceae bacterium]